MAKVDHYRNHLAYGSLCSEIMCYASLIDMAGYGGFKWLNSFVCFEVASSRHLAARDT